MSKEMFCFQCEQTAGCSGCTGKTGVCGKTSGIATLQDELTGALISLAGAADRKSVSERTNCVILEGLFTTVTNVNFNEETIKEQISAVNREKELLLKGCRECVQHCERTDGFNMASLWNAEEDIRSLK